MFSLLKKDNFYLFSYSFREANRIPFFFPAPGTLKKAKATVDSSKFL